MFAGRRCSKFFFSHQQQHLIAAVDTKKLSATESETVTKRKKLSLQKIWILLFHFFSLPKKMSQLKSFMTGLKKTWAKLFKGGVRKKYLASKTDVEKQRCLLKRLHQCRDLNF